MNFPGLLLLGLLLLLDLLPHTASTLLAVTMESLHTVVVVVVVVVVVAVVVVVVVVVGLGAVTARAVAARESS
jgi:hypothetical protein